MSIKNEELYPKYLQFLESKKLSKGAFELCKISSDFFEDFKNNYHKKPHFKDKIDNFFRMSDREDKIENIIMDDFDLFMEDMGKEVKVDEKFDDDFYDF
jgi:hypothetical protein